MSAGSGGEAGVFSREARMVIRGLLAVRGGHYLWPSRQGQEAWWLTAHAWQATYDLWRAETGRALGQDPVADARYYDGRDHVVAVLDELSRKDPTTPEAASLLSLANVDPLVLRDITDDTRRRAWAIACLEIAERAHDWAPLALGRARHALWGVPGQSHALRPLEAYHDATYLAVLYGGVRQALDVLRPIPPPQLALPSLDLTRPIPTEW